MVAVEGNSNVLELPSGPLPSNQVLHPFLTDNILGLYIGQGIKTEPDHPNRFGSGLDLEKYPNGHIFLV